MNNITIIMTKKRTKSREITNNIMIKKKSKSRAIMKSITMRRTKSKVIMKKS
jgi:hypothetical protein